MNVPFLTTLPTLKALNSSYMQYYFGHNSGAIGSHFAKICSQSREIKIVLKNLNYIGISRWFPLKWCIIYLCYVIGSQMNGGEGRPWTTFLSYSVKVCIWRTLRIFTEGCLPMLWPVTETWPGLAGVQKIGHGVNWLAAKLNIKGTIDNKGQNENFIDRESKMKLKNWNITLGLVQECASFRFKVVVSLPGFYAVKKTLKESEILARSVYKIFLFPPWWIFRRVINNCEWPTTVVEFLMNN